MERKVSKILRHYQVNAVKAILSAIENSQQKILIEMAAGTGKTIVVVELIKALCCHRENNILILVSSLEIRNHLQTLLNEEDISTSFDYKQNRHKCALMTYAEIRKNEINLLGGNTPFDFIICLDAETTGRIETCRDTLSSSKAVLIGFTGMATSSKGWFQGVVPAFRYSIEDSIKEGYLNGLNNSKYYGSAVEGFCLRLFEKFGITSQGDKISNPSHNDYPNFILSASGFNVITEIKAYRSRFVSISALNQSVSQMTLWMKSYQYTIESSDRDKYCLIMLCDVPKDLKQQIFEKKGITIWDISNLLYLVQNNSKLLNDLSKLAFFSIADLDPVAPFGWNPYISVDDVSPAVDSQIVAEFENRLQTCEIGKKAFVKYEDICSDIILYLFSKEFTLASRQHQTNDDMFRIDMLCTLKGSSAFWNLLIQHYNSRFVVFEYKNYEKQLSQNLVFITEKYLFNAALRNVAIIISRKGFSPNAMAATFGCLKESGKLIIELTDQDLIAMLKKKAAGEEPSDYILEKLETLLMSISK